MKRIVLPILEEISARPDSRFRVYKRVAPHVDVEWGQFKRIIGHLKADGMIDIDVNYGGHITITQEGKDALGSE
jgi:predicted transcriptional regulator